MMVAGLAALSATVSPAGYVATFAFVASEVVVGAGIGVIVPIFAIALTGVSDDEVGSASGVMNSIQQLGGAIGIAIPGTVFLGAARGHRFGVALHHSLLATIAVTVVASLLTWRLPPGSSISEPD